MNTIHQQDLIEAGAQIMRLLHRSLPPGIYSAKQIDAKLFKKVRTSKKADLTSIGSPKLFTINDLKSELKSETMHANTISYSDQVVFESTILGPITTDVKSFFASISSVEDIEGLQPCERCCWEIKIPGTIIGKGSIMLNDKRTMGHVAKLISLNKKASKVHFDLKANSFAVEPNGSVTWNKVFSMVHESVEIIEESKVSFDISADELKQLYEECIFTIYKEETCDRGNKTLIYTVIFTNKRGECISFSTKSQSKFEDVSLSNDMADFNKFDKNVTSIVSNSYDAGASIKEQEITPSYDLPDNYATIESRRNIFDTMNCSYIDSKESITVIGLTNEVVREIMETLDDISASFSDSVMAIRPPVNIEEILADIV